MLFEADIGITTAEECRNGILALHAPDLTASRIVWCTLCGHGVTRLYPPEAVVEVAAASACFVVKFQRNAAAVSTGAGSRPAR